jgi:hypothetical protein
VIVVERFWALDFDRCLARPSVLYDVFIDILDKRGIVEHDRLLDARRRDELSGGSFDVVSYLFRERLMSEDMFADVAAAFCVQVSQRTGEVLEEGAADFLRHLVATDQQFGIVSYGNPRWQDLKIAASGFDGMPRLIVNSKHKGRMIADWYQPDERAFLLPIELTTGGVLARDVILVDDKAAAFDGLPAQASGYWLQLHDQLLKSQAGTVPGNVLTVKTFTDIIASESISTTV